MLVAFLVTDKILISATIGRKGLPGLCSVVVGRDGNARVCASAATKHREPHAGAQQPVSFLHFYSVQKHPLCEKVPLTFRGGGGQSSSVKPLGVFPD